MVSTETKKNVRTQMARYKRAARPSVARKTPPDGTQLRLDFHEDRLVRMRACYILLMAEPATKDRILKAVEELPDDVTLDEAIEKLCFLAKVERGLKQANEGETVPHDEVKERLLG